MKSPFRTPLFIILSLSILTACEDPSNVGIGLVGDVGGDPFTATAPVEDFETLDLDRPNDIPARVLTGAVDDPLIGQIVATGYMDFTSVGSSSIRSGTLESVELRLRPTYVYGDTTGEVTVALHDIETDWDDEDLPVDTSFATGDQILEFTFLPTDSIVVVPLPEDWIDAHDQIIQGQNFAQEFHGFQLRHVSGNAVVGLGPNSTVLRSRTATDSASYPVGNAYSALQKEEIPAPENRLLIQAGTGPVASFTLNLSSDTLTAVAINRMALTFTTDTLAFAENKPIGFVRPRLTALNLFGLTNEGVTRFLGQSIINSEGRFVFDSAELIREIQQVLLGTRNFDRFELRIPTTNSVPAANPELALLSASISVALFHDTGAGELAPVGYLTVTPTDG